MAGSASQSSRIWLKRRAELAMGGKRLRWTATSYHAPYSSQRYSLSLYLHCAS